MVFVKRSVLLGTSLCMLVLVVSFADVIWADSISPVQEQEFNDARAAIEVAKQVQAEKFAPAYIKQAQDFLQTADNARQAQDVLSFSTASRLARAHADLAKASAELNAEVEKLAATNEALQKAKAVIESLKKSQ